MKSEIALQVQENEQNKCQVVAKWMSTKTGVEEAHRYTSRARSMSAWSECEQYEQTQVVQSINPTL
jgi:hypothetical protein